VIILEYKFLRRTAITLILGMLMFCSVALAGNIDPDNDGSRYAWGENVGWINFEPSQGEGVTVTDSAVTGKAWGENVGWINLSPETDGVVNDGAGNLSGYAWGENVGWISFSCEDTGICSSRNYGVTINPATGEFSGYAWGENIGWINFAPNGKPVKTSWRKCTDNDGDGYAVEGGACGLVDCNDDNPNQHPNQTWYKDTDLDGYSDGTFLIQCNKPDGYRLAIRLTATSGDCDDTNASINPASIEICNGIDDNCDGQIDEGLTTTYYQDADTDNYGDPANPIQACTQPSGYVADSTDCNDSDMSVHPGAPDIICNGIDNNCDGTPDDGYVQIPTTCGVGACASTGLTTCSAGVEGDTCIAGTPTAEICDGIDNDCNGSVDDNLTRPTTCGIGACASTGTETCTAGTWGNDTCTSGSPTAETCNNIDDNCNGSVDEGLTRPTTCGVGACSGNTGIETCNAGTWGNDTCDPFAGAAANDATCNGVDDDCNGIADEDYVATNTTCGSGVCASTGQLICENGSLHDTCKAGSPTGNDDNCNGIDENCSGTADENYTPTLTTCGIGACASTGHLICSGGSLVDTCATGQPQPESCDGIDNNCNGVIDENLIQQCGVSAIGACEYGEQTCVNGSWSTCVGSIDPTPEICDGVDNDCDGVLPSDEIDTDNDGRLDCNDNCPDVANPVQEDSNGNGIGDACDFNKICSNLGNDPHPLLPDIDIFKFSATKGETVTIRIDADPSEAGTGKKLTLILTDKIRGTVLVKLDRSQLPNEITAKLPKTGEYLITVAEQILTTKDKRYKGDYCLTLEATPEIYQTLEPTPLVE
jgi:hypothetical protein